MPKNQNVVYRFEVLSKSQITITLESLDEESDQDLYVSLGEASDTNFDWKSTLFGTSKVKILPSDPKFRIGAYSIAVHGFRAAENRFRLSLDVQEVG